MEKEIRPVHLAFEGGETYTLEFNKTTVCMAEELGYRETELPDKPMTMGTLLFYCAFLMHHPDITREETDKILLEDIGGFSDELIKSLVALYNKVAGMLINEGNTPKNPKLKVRL